MYTHTHITKYNLRSLYNVTCMYIFRTTLLVLDKQSVYSSLGKTISLTLSIQDISRVTSVCTYSDPG